MEKMDKLMAEWKQVQEKMDDMKDALTYKYGSTKAWRDIMEKDKGLSAEQPKLRKVTSSGEGKRAVSAFTFS